LHQRNQRTSRPGSVGGPQCCQRDHNGQRLRKERRILPKNGSNDATQPDSNDDGAQEIAGLHLLQINLGIGRAHGMAGKDHKGKAGQGQPGKEQGRQAFHR
jgi:hypothetical protein